MNKKCLGCAFSLSGIGGKRSCFNPEKCPFGVDEDESCVIKSDTNNLKPEGWISVHERLPEEGQEVICHCSDGTLYNSMFHCGDFIPVEFTVCGKIDPSYPSYCTFSNVTEWRSRMKEFVDNPHVEIELSQPKPYYRMEIYKKPYYHMSERKPKCGQKIFFYGNIFKEWINATYSRNNKLMSDKYWMPQPPAPEEK